MNEGAGIDRELAKHWWLQCVSCSEASMTTQMRGFGLEEPAYEQAHHAFSGGFMHLGHACGLLTGAALAAGFLARARFEDDETRSRAALQATIQLAKAYLDVSGSVNCREITEVTLTTLMGRVRYLREGKGRMCGRLHLKWAPQAQDLIVRALEEERTPGPDTPCANCAVATARRIASWTLIEEEDAVLFAGFAGGVGLLGNVCGALAAGVYALSAGRYLAREDKTRDTQFQGSLQELAGSSYRGQATRLRIAFVGRFGSELCIDIAQRLFEDIADHADYVDQGGCQEVTGFVAEWIRHQSIGRSGATRL